MKDVKFMTAKEKELTLKAWERFVKSGFKRGNFTNRIYNHLTLHCSFIAHYSRSGFYSVYFTDNHENTRRFIKQFTEGTSAEYGWKMWLTDPEYADLNGAMVDVMAKYAGNLLENNKAAEKRVDLAIAKALLAKHGYAGKAAMSQMALFDTEEVS